MPTFVSLLRGINVSGHRLIPMAALRSSCEALGFTRVRTYLQSGNVLFDAPKPAPKQYAVAIQNRIHIDFEHKVPVVVVTLSKLANIISTNPFRSNKGIDPSHLAAMVFSELKPGATLAGHALPGAPGEQVRLIDGVLFLHCPQGFGQTKLTNAFFEKLLGSPGTSRNFNTLNALNKMARES